MKKIISVLFVTAMVALVACGGKKSDLIVGAWKLADMSFNMPKEVPDSMKAKYEAQMKSQLDEMKKSSLTEFNKDGSFNAKMAGQDNKGTWKLNEDGSKITLTKDGKDDVWNILELTAAKFVFEVDQMGQKTKVSLMK
jgi:hypothetical protein